MIRGAAPLGLPDTLSRGGPVPRSVRVAPSLRSVARAGRGGDLSIFDPRGCAPRTPRHALSRGPRAPLRSRGSLAALGRSRRGGGDLYPRGCAPRTPRHALSRGPRAPLRSRGSLAALGRSRRARRRPVIGEDTRCGDDTRCHEIRIFVEGGGAEGWGRRASRGPVEKRPRTHKHIGPSASVVKKPARVERSALESAILMWSPPVRS